MMKTISYVIILTMSASNIAGRAQILSNGDFEVPQVPSGTGVYWPTNAAWVWTGPGGIISPPGFVPGEDASFRAPAAPSGAQLAFVQFYNTNATMWQVVTLPSAGTYRLSYYDAGRPYWTTGVGGDTTYQILVDTNVIATLSTTTGQPFSPEALTFTSTAGNHTLSFEVLAAPTYDNTVFFDAIDVELVSLLNCAAAPAGLVSWWPADPCPVALDLISGNHGCLHGVIGFAPGAVGNAFTFDGSTAYIDCGDAPSLRLEGSFSLEAWVNPAPPPPTDDLMAIISKWAQECTLTQGSGDAYMLDLAPQGTNWTVLGGVGDGTTCETNPLVGGFVPTGQWSHIVMTYDSISGTNIIYVNGSAVGSRVKPNGTLASHTRVLIGREDSWRVRAFQGLIDEPSVYERALSASEVLALYNSGKCPPNSTDPTLQILRACNNPPLLLWPTGATGYRLLTTTNIQTGPWEPVATLPTIVGAQNTVPTDGIGTRFYRLVR